MRWAWILGLLVLTAGCLGGAGEQARLTPQEAAELDEEELEEVERELSFEDEVVASADQGRIDGIEWPAPLGPSLAGLELEMTWEQEAHAFGLDVDGPTDVEIGPEQDPTQARLSAEITDPEPGSYAFYPTQEGVIASDTLALTVRATFEVPKDDSLTVAGCTDIEARQTADGWRASFTCQASGPTSSAKQVDADTVNGEITLEGNADNAMATVDAWAEGDTEQEARERALSIDVTVLADDDEMVARAESYEWEDRGADVDMDVDQATLTGEADTTNGPVAFADVQTDGFQADTTNGPIQGDIETSGDLDFDTTNGPIRVDVTPEDDVDIQADTTNGPIDLGLAETRQIAYTIDAATTNGQITESMDEADLHGEEDDATLVTENGDGRPIQVSGDTDTTNGNIHFDGR